MIKESLKLYNWAIRKKWESLFRNWAKFEDVLNHKHEK
jgi:hypothetical protein